MKFLKYLLFVTVAFIGVIIVKGLLTPSVSYECEVRVNKPAGEAWAVMSDESKLSQWIEGYIRGELVSGTRNAVGAVSNIYVEENGEEMVMQETITGLEINKLMAMTFTMDFMDMDYEISFEEDNGKTIIRSKSVTRGNGIMAKIIISFMPDSMKKQEEKNLATLKRLIEENTKDYFSEPISAMSK